MRFKHTCITMAWRHACMPTTLHIRIQTCTHACAHAYEASTAKHLAIHTRKRRCRFAAVVVNTFAMTHIVIDMRSRVTRQTPRSAESVHTAPSRMCAYEHTHTHIHKEEAAFKETR